ncbi:hypothetical protein WMF31_19300 [Sorangium sp. So ce1036]|uniref:hypothetical protein n=1 Tax=Sorangium sp. So ce1036 TaxID=3133328 RepID=UPI003F06BB84
MISDVEIENEIRASVAEFLEGMRALVRKDILQSVARHLEVDIRAAGISIEPALTPIKPARKVGGALAPSRVAAPARKKPAPRRPAPSKPAPSKPAPSKPARAASGKKAVAPRAAVTARPRAATPAPRASDAGTAGAAGADAAGARPAESAAGEKAAEQAIVAGTEAPQVAASGPGDEIAEALLAHVEIEPGQGLEELALAMGTPAADLEGPIKRLVEENKITEEMRQGQAAYYPT